jgi:branched-chain amino acid transport system ATP-binding protein
VTEILRLTDVDAAYRRGTVVISGVNLSVDEGTVTTVLGANGAGKTTLLRTVAGQLVNARGVVSFKGSPLGRIRVMRRVALGIALVPQGHQVFGGMSVAENLRMGAFSRRRSHSVQESLNEVFEIFPVLADRRRQTASSLSGGERAMLAVGRGLMSRPTLLLLDEPSLGLAPKVRQVMFDALATISRRTAMTILMAEQDVALALEASDHAFVLQGGRIVHHGTAAETLASSTALRQAYLGL